MPRYRNNFISEAIIRADFEKPLNALNTRVDDDLEIEVMKFFTLKEVREAFSESIRIDQTGKVDRDKVAFNEWNFWANEKKKRFCITQNFMFIAYNKYINYDDFTTPFMSILRELASIYPDFSCKRLGMRYINNVRLDEHDVFAWDDYLDKKCLSILSIPEKVDQIRRAFHILELNYPEDDFKVKFQYGIHNPDYPSEVKQKLFVLDYDAYKDGILTKDELIHLVPLFHSKIELIFESVITQRLRDKLNE